jgi:hypothetical protein
MNSITGTKQSSMLWREMTKCSERLMEWTQRTVGSGKVFAYREREVK